MIFLDTYKLRCMNNNYNLAKDNNKILLDSFLIFLNLSTSSTIIPYILCFQYHRFICGLIIVLIDLIYIACRFRKLYVLRREPLFYVYVILNLVNLMAAYITDTGWYAALAYLTLNSVFYYLLFCIYKTYIQVFSVEDTYRNMIRGYWVLVMICVVSCIILFVLMKVGVNLYVNSVNTTFDLFKTNYENLGSNYYFPYCLGILLDTPDLRIPFFQDDGIITGIFHEPHCLTFMIFPAFFLMLYYAKSTMIRLMCFFVYLFILLISGSTTNILALIGCFVVYILYNAKGNIIKCFFILFATIILVNILFIYIDTSNLQFILNKLDSSSMGYSQVTLEFAITPKTLLGTSFYDVSEVSSFGNANNMDVGYINFFLNILYLLICIFYLFRLFISTKIIKLAYLLFGCYFFFHSMKVAMPTYSYTMLTFITFLISHLAKTSDRRIDLCL